MSLKYTIIAATAALFSFAAPGVFANPVLNFAVNGPGSSATATLGKNVCLLACSVTTTLDSNLGSQAFSLSQGQSDTFNFFNIAVDGLGAGKVKVSADLAFSLPQSEVVVGKGKGEFVTFFGFLSAGELTWTEPAPGSAVGRFQLHRGPFQHFDDGFWQLSGSNRNSDCYGRGDGYRPGSSCPEPASMGLLGAGLLSGLAFIKRRRSLK